MKPLTEHTCSELVKLHNSLVPPTKAVTRFATKEAAIRRVGALIAGKSSSPTDSPEGASRVAKTNPPSQKGKLQDGPLSPRRSTVFVEGPGGPCEYRSVAVAFRKLGLPFGKHQSFRKHLKLSLRRAIEQYTFYTTKP